MVADATRDDIASLDLGGYIFLDLRALERFDGGYGVYIIEHSQFRRRQYYTKWRVLHPVTSGTS